MEWRLYLCSLIVFSVFFEVTVSTNLALNKPATSSTFWDKDARYAVDGNSASNWGGGSCFQASANDWNPWWQVDLEDFYEITHIVATTRSDSCCNTRLHDFSVELYMNDPTVVPSPTPKICLYHPGNLAPGVQVTLTCSATHTGRYVVLRGNATRNNDDRFTICELEIYGSPGSAPCQTCTKYFRTTGTRREASLTGTPLSADTLDRCARECNRDIRCSSFNFSQDSSPPCELLLDVPTNTLSVPGWNYYQNHQC